MSANHTAVNQAAINGGSNARKFGEGAITAAATVAAVITYVWAATAVAATEATVSSSANQTHAASRNLPTSAVISTTPVATKYVLSTMPADAGIVAAALGAAGGAEFPANATVTAAAHFDYPTSATLSGGASASVDDAQTWRTRYTVSQFDMEPRAAFVADPSYLANGETTYVHYVGTGGDAYGIAGVTYAPSAVKIFSDRWVPFAGSTFNVTASYKWLEDAAFVGACGIFADPVDNFFAECELVAQATALTATAQKRAPSDILFQTQAGIITPSPTLRVLAGSRGQAIAGMSNTNTTIAAFGGYPQPIGTAEITLGEVTHVVAADADMSAQSGVQSTYSVWTVQLVTSAADTSANMLAAASIQGYDAIVFSRAAETKDFNRAAESKNFVRANL